MAHEGDRRETTRLLARQFAEHLRHLREFRGTRYARATPTPRRLSTSPEGQVNSPAVAAAEPDPAVAVATPIAATRERVSLSSSGASVTPREVRAPTHLPIADPSSLPGVAEPASAEPPRPGPGDTGLRAQAQTWTAAEKLAYLRTRNIGNCTRCKLAKTRTNIVFGVGNPDAQVMFVGEAPGGDEDRVGEPFVGAAGRRLTVWLERLGMTREQVYIANVLKCRPPGNRNPEPDEIARCSPFLQAQIRAIRPEVLIALGRYGGMFLIGTKEELLLKDMRSRLWTYEDPAAGLRIPLHITYHPSYVIRRESELAPGQRNVADDTVMSDLTKALRALRAR